MAARSGKKEASCFPVCARVQAETPAAVLRAEKERFCVLDARAISWEEKRMEYPLHFGKQVWKPVADGDLTVFLPGEARWGFFFGVDFTFVPPWVNLEEEKEEHRRMSIMANGYLQGLKDWNDLDGWEVKDEEDVIEDGEVIVDGASGPHITIMSSGTGTKGVHTHAQDGWETRLKFTGIVGGNRHVLTCELEAFYPTERARKASADWWLKQFIGEDTFEDELKAQEREEGWRLTYTGRVALEHFYCHVPVNHPDPILRAKQMVERAFGLKRFGFPQVAGGKLDGTFKPEDGVSEHGRLVLLGPPSLYYEQWKARQEEKKKRQNPPNESL